MSEYERLIKRLIFLLRLKGCVDRMIMGLYVPLPELEHITNTYTTNNLEYKIKRNFIFYGYNNNKPIKKEIESTTYKSYISALDVIKPLEPRKINKKFEMEYLGKFVEDEEIKPMQTGIEDEEIEAETKTFSDWIRFEDL